MTAPQKGLERLGRDQGLLMMWMNSRFREDPPPLVLSRTYFDTLVIDPRDFDPAVKIMEVKNQPNWHLVFFSLVQRELVVARFEVDLTTIVVELRYPESFRMRLASDR